METKLARISQLSKENPDMVFTSLGHLINKEMLKNCHAQMDGTKAVGIDGITKEEYGRNLEENINALIERLKKKSYKPKPAKLVEIPKDNGKMRPLSIYCYEDKLVQEALRRILEAVFEPIFYDEMMGFRPNRGCHKAIRKLNLMLERKPTNYVLDADIKGFFQHLDHEWIIRFIGSRIKDPNIIRLVRRMLKAGIMNNYEFEETEEGSGQGSVCSPVISCIYMHYVLVWWFKEVITPKLKGYAGLVVYADDFVVTFQYKSDAEWFYEHLKHRMGHFGLSLEEEKSRLIEFGRYAKERCREVNLLLVKMRTCRLKEMIAKLNQILTGYYHYYGITDNTESITAFRYNIMRRLFYCLNRRSQKKSYNWVEFLNMLDNSYPLVRPRIYVNIYE